MDRSAMDAKEDTKIHASPSGSGSIAVGAFFCYQYTPSRTRSNSSRVYELALENGLVSRSERKGAMRDDDAHRFQARGVPPLAYVDVVCPYSTVFVWVNRAVE